MEIDEAEAERLLPGSPEKRDQRTNTAEEGEDEEGEEEKMDGDKESSFDRFLGAKPKVRPSLDDTKKRRRILKKAHSVSHSPLQSQSSGEIPVRQTSLDSRRHRRASEDFSHPDSGHKLLVLDPPPFPKPKESEKHLRAEQSRSVIDVVNDEPQPSPRRTCPEFFGVRSYLHTFYESVSIGNPGMYEDFGEPEYRYLIAPAKKRRAACLWKTALWLGINLLAFGLVMILVGYLVPKRDIVVGQEDYMEIIDRTAMRFNSNLDLCKLVGLVVFCVGGTILVAVLLFPSLMNQYCDDDPVWSPEEFRVQVGGYQEPPKTPTEKKVPATEELFDIQPKEKQEEKVVMTNSGLCKVP